MTMTDERHNSIKAEDWMLVTLTFLFNGLLVIKVQTSVQVFIFHILTNLSSNLPTVLKISCPWKVTLSICFARVVQLHLITPKLYFSLIIIVINLDIFCQPVTGKVTKVKRKNNLKRRQPVCLQRKLFGFALNNYKVI